MVLANTETVDATLFGKDTLLNHATDRLGVG
jgi:hypothetical protein